MGNLSDELAKELEPPQPSAIANRTRFGPARSSGKEELECSIPYPIPVLENVTAKVQRDGETFSLTNIEGKQPEKFRLSNFLGIPPSPATLTREKILNYAKIIDVFAATKGNYREKAMSNENFKKLYNVGKHSFQIIHNGSSCCKEYLSAPCTLCGIVLPTQILQVDHQRPQKNMGMDSLHQAVFKVFRVLGMTNEAPKGVKGHMAFNKNIDDLTKLWASGTVPSGTGNIRHRALYTAGTLEEENERRNNRYTLNREGIIFYCVIKHFKLKQMLEDECLHSLLNLRFICSFCNTGRNTDTIKEKHKFEYVLPTEEAKEDKKRKGGDKKGRPGKRPKGTS